MRVRPLNTHDLSPGRTFILYWMIAARRLQSNFALERAVTLARERRVPLVIFEPLRAGYRWANDRLHQFVIEGMADHARALAGTPVTYLPYVEPKPGEGRGLLAALARHAVAVVTDDYPAFFLPRMVTAAAAQVDTQFEAVDSNGLLPMRAAGREFVTAFSHRAYIHNHFREHLRVWPAAITFDDLPRLAALPPGLDRWRFTPPAELDTPARLIAALPIDHSVPPVEWRGGDVAGRAALDRFIASGLGRYADDRNEPSLAGTSRLSPYLHFGHLSAHDVFAAVAKSEGWRPSKLAIQGGKRSGVQGPPRGSKAGWWGVSAHAEGYLDQLITWRELGFNMCVSRPDGYDRYASLPNWARATLEAHAADEREWTYSREAFAAADTHDPLWNAAQRELTHTGWMHNYLRMLWGKKILEWSASPEAALDHMIDIMNRYALDGRDPNSYTGYCWTLGRYDRPWFPERPVFGTIRYMSSANTAKKLNVKPYLQRFGPEAAGRLPL